MKEIKTVDDAIGVLSKAGTEDLFEKAHKVGDIHPNHPDWVWTEYAPGKFDWRSNKKSGSKATTTKAPKAKSTDKEKVNLQQEYSTLSQLVKKPSTSSSQKKEFQERMKEIEGMGLQVINGKFQWKDVTNDNEKGSLSKEMKAESDVIKDFNYRSKDLKISNHITGTKRKNGLWVVVNTSKMSNKEKNEFDKIQKNLDGKGYRIEPNGVSEYWIQKTK